MTNPTPTYGTVTLQGPLYLGTWTTSTRPASPTAGATGFNSTTGLEETWNGTAWVSAGFSLPTASTTVLGGVKVDGTTVLISGGGVISAPGGSSGNYTAPYTGGVTRTVTSKLSDIVSVIDFGADPTGTTDSTAAIQAAINSGQAVFFPTGTYKVSTTITLNKAGQLIFGSGNGSVIMTDSTTNVVLSITAQEVELHSLTINSSVTRTGGEFIDIVNVGYVHIHDMLLQNLTNGLRMSGSGVAGIRVHDVTMNLCHGTGAGLEIDSGVDVVISDVLISGTSSGSQISTGFAVFACGDVTLRHCATVFAGDGLAIAPASGAVVQSLLVTECLFDSGNGAGIDVEATGLVQLLKITDTWVATNAGGITLNTHGSGAIQQTDILNCVVSNNTGQGLLINTTSVTGTNVIGSSFGANTGDGIFIAAGCTLFKIIACSCGIQGEFSGNGSYGIGLGAGCDEFIICNNQVLGNTTGSISYGTPGGTPGGTNFTYNNVGFSGGSGGGGSGTVNTSAQFLLAFYPSAGTAVSGATAASYQVSGSNAILGLGNNAGLGGQVDLSGATSGTTGITAPAAAGNYTLTVPPNTGSLGQLLATDGTGVTSWNWATTVFGVTDGSNAGSGFVGEFISASVAAGSAVALTNGVSANVTSISLTAGDWDVHGTIEFTVPGTNTNITILSGWTNTVSASSPTQPGVGSSFLSLSPAGMIVASGEAGCFPTGAARVSVTGTTTVYLSVFTNFTVSTLSAFGFISARRVR